MLKVRYKKLHPNATKPRKSKDPKDAGFDLFPTTEGVIPAKGRRNIILGFATEFDEGHVGLILDRSGMGNKGMLRLAGVIDCNYRGEWQAIIYNTTDQSFYYTPGVAIAQVVYLELPKVDDEGDPDLDGWVAELSDSIRGTDGFGSSDKKTDKKIEESIDFNTKAKLS